MTPRDRVLAEEHEWDQVAGALATDGSLLSVSSLIGDSRIYRTPNGIVKIRRMAAAAKAGVHSLEEEVAILNRLGRSGQAGSTGEWEYLRTPYLAGRELAHLRIQSGRLKALVATTSEVLRLNRSGVSHGDLRAENILVREDGHIQLIDFDRARVMRPGRAMFRDWLGLSPFGGGSSVAELALYSFFPQAQSVARRMRARLRSGHVQIHGDRDVVALDRAWHFAAESDANAPGDRLAYYAWTYKGTHYLGERPWAFRWEILRNAVSFEGKRVLELGSNMAMTSAYALMHGASEATAVDSDEVILDAAALLGTALEVPIKTLRVAFNDSPAWEEALPDADIAIAMSILEWVPDRTRFEKYLGRFAELVFEGHESAEVERERLTQLGFREITLAGMSERGRPLFVARR